MNSENQKTLEEEKKLSEPGQVEKFKSPTYMRGSNFAVLTVFYNLLLIT